MNIVDADMTPDPVAGQWSDLSFLVAGPAVRQYAAIFHQDWQFATGVPLEWAPAGAVAADGEAIVQVVPSGPDVEDDPLYDAIMTGVFQATDRVWIVTPYFVPTEALTNALVIACRRGIDVRINVPAKSNHPLSDWAGAAALRDIQAAGGRILRYTDGMVHAKLMVIDRQAAMAGSANMDMRSLLINSEVMQFSYTQHEIDAVEKYMIDIAAASVEGIPEPGHGRQLIEGALRILAPQI